MSCRSSYLCSAALHARSARLESLMWRSPKGGTVGARPSPMAKPRPASCIDLVPLRALVCFPEPHRVGAREAYCSVPLGQPCLPMPVATWERAMWSFHMERPWAAGTLHRAASQHTAPAIRALRICCGFRMCFTNASCVESRQARSRAETEDRSSPKHPALSPNMPVSYSCHALGGRRSASSLRD